MYEEKKMQAPTLDPQLEAVSLRYDLLQHPFYRRWVAGDVTRDELAYYAGQYAHVVRAIPRWLEEAAARDPRHAAKLKLHAAEESDHIHMWDAFGAALGVDASTLRSSAANPATAAFIALGDELVEQGQGAAAVWSIEAQSPAVSAEKLRGLKAHYGIDATTGGEYFAVHQELDREHEAHLRGVIQAQREGIRQAAPTAASSMLAGMWDMLSSVRC